jgi:pyrroline-5-carboxylate reductase
MNPNFSHGFIGIGNMAQVILHALLEDRHASPKDVIVSRNNRTALRNLKKKFKVHTTTDNREVAGNCQYLWVAVKPFQAHGVLKQIGPFLGPKTILITMMAGVSTSYIRKVLDQKIHVLRIMPNTPALLGQGMIGAFFSKDFPKRAHQMFLKILGDLGEVLELKRESDFDVVTGLSGSGPAFVYKVAQGLINGGLKGGLKLGQARLLALQTLRGAVSMLEATGKDPEVLISQVTSKRGTTEAGLKELKKAKTSQSLTRAVLSATQRSKEIRKTLE